GEVGGKVFRDYDSDGVQDALEPNFAPSGTVVRGYDTSGDILATSAVSSNGEYTLGSISVENGVRLELSGITDSFEEGTHGSGSASTVRFVSSAGCSYNFAIQNPVQYCQDDPDIAISCFQSGTGVGNSAAGLISFAYSATGIPAAYGGTAVNPSADVTVAELGTVWGSAYQKESKRLFLASFLKRHSGFGPQGIGGVYVVDYSADPPTLSGSFTLSGLNPSNGGASVNLGSITRSTVNGAIAADNDLSNDSEEPSIDLDAFNKVGTISYG
ncbi:MAG: hypothetical protein KDD53_13040, partial [Bdellovibrionales bacterium]|nr:hypothetical protein [Bdellovibrionales bacterium]